MKTFLKNEVMSYIREPFAFFFSIILPIGLIFIYGETFGQYSYNEVLSGYDMSLLFNIIFLLANLGCMGLIQGMVEKKATFFVKREAVLPFSKFQKFVLNIFSTVVLAILITAIILIINYTIYDISITLNVWFVIAYFVVMFNFFSFGYMISLLKISPKTVQAIGLFFFFGCMFLSGLVVPFEDSAVWMKNISTYSPFNVSLKTFTMIFDMKNILQYKYYIVALIIYTAINSILLFNGVKKNK